MKSTIIRLLIASLLLPVAFFCGQKKSSTSSTDTTKALVSATAEPPEFEEVQPLPEADTIRQAPCQLRFSLRKSELWGKDTVTQLERQLTFTNAKIDSFLVSPTGKYAVCLHQVSWVKSPGIFEKDEDPGKEPIYSLLVVRTVDGTIIRDVKRPLDLFFDFNRWISNSRLLCVTSDGFAVGSYFVYDAFRDSLQRVPLDFAH